MNDEFVTAAIREDRYLKAHRLIDRFETEIRSELERAGAAMVEANRELFADSVEPNWNHDPSSGTIVAFARVDFPMNRVRSVNDSTSLTLNISLRWLDPVEYGHDDVEGALCVASYKIKDARPEDHERVKERTSTDEWSIQFSDDAFSNSPGIFYVPVDNAEEIRQAHETLREHFTTYGSEIGVHPDDE